MNLPDIQQLQKQVALHRNERAYEQLFVSFYDRLRRFSNNLLRHSETAEEFVSDVMRKVWTMEVKLAEVKI